MFKLLLLLVILSLLAFLFTCNQIGHDMAPDFNSIATVVEIIKKYTNTISIDESVKTDFIIKGTINIISKSKTKKIIPTTR